MYLCAKDPYKAKYLVLIKKRQITALKHLNGSKTFIEYLNDVDDIHRNIAEYNPNKKCKILIVFDYMFAYILSNKKLTPIVTELFIRGRKLNIFLVIISQFYFVVPKSIRLNSTHNLIMKILNKQELQQVAFNHSSGIDFKDFMNLYKKCTVKPYSFLVIDATLASDNPSHFKKNFLERI